MMNEKNGEVVRAAGRPKGSANRSTRQAREAIAQFVNSSVPQFSRWLGQVAEGIPKVDLNGDPLRDHQGSIVWVNKPDPAQAMKLVAEVAEYHLPKLSRQEVTSAVKLEGPQDYSSLTIDDIDRLILQKLGVGAVPGEFSMVEQVTQHVPEFLQEPQEAITPPRTIPSDPDPDPT
jgi:hypothetical protein